MFAFCFSCKFRWPGTCPYARDVVLRLPWLHIHGGRYKALATRDVGRWWLIGWIQVIAVVTIGSVVSALVDVVVFGRVAEDWRGAAVQGSGGLIIQVLQRLNTARFIVHYFMMNIGQTISNICKSDGSPFRTIHVQRYGKICLKYATNAKTPFVLHAYMVEPKETAQKLRK